LTQADLIEPFMIKKNAWLQEPGQSESRYCAINNNSRSSAHETENYRFKTKEEDRYWNQQASGQMNTTHTDQWRYQT